MATEPTNIGTYLPRIMEDLLVKALDYAADHSPALGLNSTERGLLTTYARALENDTYFLETTIPRPEPVLWQAGWGVPGINDACEFTTHNSWSDAIEAVLDEVALRSKNGHEAVVQAQHRRLFYGIEENTEGWRRVGDLAYWVRKAPSAEG